MQPLLQSFQLGPLTLPNRVVMAPMTRARCGDDRVPNDLVVEYYRQRAGAGLIITEATQISEQAAGWEKSPGIHREEMIAGWSNVTKAVHDRGGRIFLQLWHTGRASHPDFQPNGQTPVSSSAVVAEGEVHTPSGKKEFVEPRALETDEIAGIVADYATATRNARKAGFDGVEIHAANGYLIDQFLRDGVNRREDEYGGSVENRTRFLREVTSAVCETWDPASVGVRLSPTSPYNDMKDSDPVATFTHAAMELGRFGLAYLHVLEPKPEFNHFLAGDADEFVTPLMRDLFSGPFMVNGGYNRDTANSAITQKETDLVAFGRPYIANPDLVARFENRAPLNEPDQETFYTHEARGYTDYPSLQDAAAADVPTTSAVPVS